MIDIRLIAIDEKVGGAKAIAAQGPFVLESNWESRPLLNHFFTLLGLRQAPDEPVGLSSDSFDLPGLRSMAGVCGDYADLIGVILTLRDAGFAFYVAGHLTKQNSYGSNPNDDVALLGIRYTPARDRQPSYV